MKHLGDICKINGAEIEAVDVITGGSPCQDLSVAGKRAGLDGERSGLFMEQMRIVREMRGSTTRADEHIRPRFMVWENVPGAFSSNKGEDYRIVLEEICKIADGNAYVPRPPSDKWSDAGCIMGTGYSVAWRVFDAQFWGVPQRRRRIAVVTDFGGYAAPEILFVKQSVHGDTAESRAKGQGTAASVEGGVGEPILFEPRSQDAEPRIHGNICPSLNTAQGGQRQPCICLQGNGIDRADTAGCNGKGWTEDVSYTLNTIDRPAVFAVDCRNGVENPNVNGTLQAKSTGGTGVNFQNTVRVQDKSGPLMANTHPGGYSGQDAYSDMLIPQHQTVRRLTPLECERLQGFPDGWTDIPCASDSARNKSLGNSIALPQWAWILQRIRNQYDRPITLGSLFDGIGGFPLCHERINGKGTARWASEIEKFPIAVTKYHFGEE